MAGKRLTFDRPTFCGKLIALCLALFAGTPLYGQSELTVLFYSAHRTDLFISFRFAMWLRITQVVGIGFLFVPITAAGYIGVPPERATTSPE